MTENAMNSLVDTKLTRGEAIDLLIQEVKDDVAAQLKANESDLLAARHSFTPADIKVGINTLRLGERYGNEKYSLTVDLTKGDFTEAGRVKLEAIKELEEHREVLRKQEWALNERGSKAKNAVLKTMLEGSEEGRMFLELLTGLRLKVAPKLLKSKDE